MGGVLRPMGYNVEYVQADYLAQFAGLEPGDLHVAMEIWETTGTDALAASLATGKTVDLGETGMLAKEEWWYPAYMKEKCPGLPDWEALRGLRRGLLHARDRTQGPLSRRAGDLGRLRRGAGRGARPAVRGGPRRHRRRPLRRARESAYQRKAPFIGWIYTPHWAPIKYEGEWVEFPEYEAACYTDATWGSNPDATHDCGKPFGWIKKVGWAGGEEKWPAPTRRSATSGSTTRRWAS